MTAPISLRILSDNAMREIHAASLDILDRTGVLVEDEPARAMLARQGCYVEGERVRIPSTVVEEALRLAPKRVTVWDRDGRSIAMHLEARHNYFGGGSDCPFVIDPETGERRRARLEDVARLARLNDGLTHINFIMSMALPQDVPAEISDVLAFLAMTENSTKPICFTVFTPERLETIYQVMKAIRSEADLRRRPFAIHYAEPVSPLRHPSSSVSKVRFCAERGIPTVYAPCVMAGGTAPVTLAGVLAMANAECLSGLVLSQGFAAGAPCVFGALATVLDMKTTVFSYGAPEFQLMTAALSDLIHHYGLPCWSQAGMSESKEVDAQTGTEYALGILSAALAGANLIHDVGYLDQGLTSSLESCVLADEAISMVRRFMRGIEVTPETLAVDVIDRVGPNGNFLGEEHTLKYMRSEIWYPTVFERRRFEDWAKDGAQPLKVRLRERAVEILKTHRPVPLPGETLKVLRGIADELRAGSNQEVSPAF